RSTRLIDHRRRRNEISANRSPAEATEKISRQTLRALYLQPASAPVAKIEPRLIPRSSVPVLSFKTSGARATPPRRSGTVALDPGRRPRTPHERPTARPPAAAPAPLPPASSG